MDDSISRKAVMDEINSMPVMIDANGMKYVEKSLMIIRMELLPSEQPEIIHCKECKYAHMTYDGDCKY